MNELHSLTIVRAKHLLSGVRPANTDLNKCFAFTLRDFKKIN